jgi:hypothetical protein
VELAGAQSECQEMTQSECEANHHIFFGAGTTCTPDIDCTTLAVTMESTSALARGNTVVIAWTTSFESDNAGFRVLRQDAEQREKALVAVSGVIPSAGNNLTGATYEFVDESRGAATAQVYFIESIDIYGRQIQHGPIQVERTGREAPARREAPAGARVAEK